MEKEVFPQRLHHADLKKRGLFEHVCCICKTQNISDTDDIGWVACPLIKSQNNNICLGCCIDIASTCRSDNFSGNSYYDVIAVKTGDGGVNKSILAAIKKAGFSASPIKTSTLVFDVSGMTCSGCESKIKKSLLGLKGVKSVEASFKKASATVVVDSENTKKGSVKKAIEKVGFKAKAKASSLGLGQSCEVSCVEQPRKKVGSETRIFSRGGSCCQ